MIRKLTAVETLGCTQVICSDKTGTLTQNKMTVEDYYVDGKRISVADINLDNRNQKMLLNCSMLCNDSTNTDGQEIGDPTETALINLGSNLGMEAAMTRERYPRMSEVPFDSDRKLMSTAHVFDDRYVMVVKGAVDVLLRRMSHIRIGDTVREITDEDQMQIEIQNLEFSRDGLRVLAFAYKELDGEKELSIEDEEGLTFLGLIAMMDPPREESKAAVEECIKAGIRPIMITGDHKITAAAIAKRIGILKDESEACEGAVIEEMSDEELKDFVEKISVYARVSPEHKLKIVNAYKRKGKVVAMTGDGVNDAPALKAADIGCAMGKNGTDVAKGASDMIITDDNFATIVDAVREGRGIYANIKKTVIFLLSSNFGEIMTMFFAILFSFPAPLKASHILWINLITDSLPALALGTDVCDGRELMKEKPRKQGESLYVVLRFPDRIDQSDRVSDRSCKASCKQRTAADPGSGGGRLTVSKASCMLPDIRIYGSWIVTAFSCDRNA